MTFFWIQHKYRYILLFAGLLIGCVPLAPTGSSNQATATNITENGIYVNRVFNSAVQTVQLMRPNEPSLGAVIPISQEIPLVLTFDYLETENGGNTPEVHAKIVHCNADWSKSNLNNIEFLPNFNEFPINTIDFSFNTKVPYSHYQFQVPPVKISGNYILKVYKNRDENDVLFTHRFMVYQNTVAIGAQVNISNDVAARNTNQQIDFTINYNNINLPNPADGLWVVVRKNQAWYNAIAGLKPTFIREVDKQLEYNHYNLENNFAAGNEYRYFDLRSTHFKGQNVERVVVENNPIDAFLMPDKSRGGEAYSQYNDLDGEFTIGNAETQNSGNTLDADYIQTHFFLKSESPAPGDVYITGAFNNRLLTPENKMKYDPELKGYLGKLFLKQGFYNYQYYVKSNNQSVSPYFFEGSHYETENQYEIFVYNRPIGTQADLLIGYYNIFYNARNRN